MPDTGGQASRLAGRLRWLLRQLGDLRADDGNEQSGVAKSPRGEHGPVNRGHQHLCLLLGPPVQPEQALLRSGAQHRRKPCREALEMRADA